jgi:hypothetical protein
MMEQDKEGLFPIMICIQKAEDPVTAHRTQILFNDDLDPTPDPVMRPIDPSPLPSAARPGPGGGGLAPPKAAWPIHRDIM